MDEPGQPATAAERRERFRMLRMLTEQLTDRCASERTNYVRSWRSASGRLHANAVLQRRDYSFCLFPADLLRPFCTQFLSVR